MKAGKKKIIENISLFVVVLGFFYAVFAVQYEVNTAIHNNNIMWESKMQNCICWNDTDGNKNINQDTERISQYNGEKVTPYNLSLSFE
jgi:hypothetical protein